MWCGQNLYMTPNVLHATTTTTFPMMYATVTNMLFLAGLSEQRLMVWAQATNQLQGLQYFHVATGESLLGNAWCKYTNTPNTSKASRLLIRVTG